MADTSDKSSDSVIERPDGFFGVKGMAETTYYSSREIAERVAKNIAAQKAAKAAESAA